jgi:hypothetical protein
MPGAPLFSQNATLIEVSPPVHHMGSVPDNQPVHCVFILTNRSQEVMKIVKVNTPCVCTVATPNPSELEPGRETRVEIILNPKNRFGFLRWEIGVVTNLSEAAILLPFDVTIYKDGFISQEAVYFGEIRRGVAVEKKIWVSPRLAPDFHVNKVYCEVPDLPECFAVSWEAVVYDGFYPAPRRAYCINVAPRKDIPFGRIEGKLYILTDAPGYEKIELPVAVVVSGEIGLSRDYLAFGLVAHKRAVTKSIMVYNREGKSFKMQSANVNLPFAHTEIKNIIPDQYYEVSVTVRPDRGTSAGEFRGKLTIATSSEDQPTLHVAVQGFVPLAASEEKQDK